ncbi:MAG: adenylyltransferase/cytidyltransferase family protein [Chloroflexi bacterium]|nr:adenylyltransferase/cytidyltransferase family protein [Chloroflexota bacterium]
MTERRAKKVFVSGCFDLLHSGHVEFLQRAAAYGDLYVALGADRTVYELKGRPPVNSEEERRFMVQSLSCVHRAFVSRGSGMLDFVEELREVRPDIFVVNEDGNTPDKRKLCAELGIQYIVLQREPHAGLAPRSTTALRALDQMPYRIDLAGGWLDQPFVSKHHPGSVITLSIEPTVEFNDRSGMATSTRRTALELWGARLPAEDPHKLAWVLFCCDNPPGTEYISGAQDAVGIVFPGLARSHYIGEYWPDRIEQLCDEGVLRFAEELLYLVPLGPRPASFDVLGSARITPQGARRLAEATEECWRALAEQDAAAFGATVRASFEAQVAMFPDMHTPAIAELITQYQDLALGWKVSGAGGAGYLILVSDTPVEGTIRPRARRASE